MAHPLRIPQEVKNASKDQEMRRKRDERQGGPFWRSSRDYQSGMSRRDILVLLFHPHVYGFPEKDSGQTHPPKDLRVGVGLRFYQVFLLPGQVILITNVRSFSL